MKTNFEQYKEDILKYSGHIKIDKNTMVIDVCDSMCKSCFFDNENVFCSKLIREWFCKEYKPQRKHKLYQHEVDLIKCFIGHYGTQVVKNTMTTLEKEGWFKGVVDFHNVTVDEVLSNHELIE